MAGLRIELAPQALYNYRRNSPDSLYFNSSDTSSEASSRARIITSVLENMLRAGGQQGSHAVPPNVRLALVDLFRYIHLTGAHDLSHGMNHHA